MYSDIGIFLFIGGMSGIILSLIIIVFRRIKCDKQICLLEDEYEDLKYNIKKEAKVCSCNKIYTLPEVKIDTTTIPEEEPEQTRKESKKQAEQALQNVESMYTLEEFLLGIEKEASCENV